MLHHGIDDEDGQVVRTGKVNWILEARGIDTKFIDPGSPWQNGHNESFNSVFRDGCLNCWAFLSVREARLVVESWRREYDEERPHGPLTPFA